MPIPASTRIRAVARIGSPSLIAKWMHSTRPGSASFAMPPHTSLPGKCGQVPGMNPERCGAADEAERFLFEAVDSTRVGCMRSPDPAPTALDRYFRRRSEEHTSELQSHLNLVCRL